MNKLNRQYITRLSFQFIKSNLTTKDELYDWLVPSDKIYVDEIWKKVKILISVEESIDGLLSV